MPTTSNFGWTTPADTDLVKNGALAIRTLGNGIDTSMAELKGGTTGQVLSKSSNTDMDFSWVAIDPLTILDAKGDLITATAADTPARLAVGTNGQVLTADSTTATGLKWATAGGGGKVLQVVQGTTNTQASVNSTTYADTNLSATITPSATSSKILIIVNQNGMAKTGNNQQIYLKLVRNGTDVVFWGRSNYLDGSSIRLDHPRAHIYLDSPSSTSALTYKTQFKNDAGGTVYCQVNSDENSGIILMEIGA